jgi:hypothetical protein
MLTVRSIQERSMHERSILQQYQKFTSCIFVFFYLEPPLINKTRLPIIHNEQAILKLSPNAQDCGDFCRILD